MDYIISEKKHFTTSPGNKITMCVKQIRLDDTVERRVNKVKKNIC